MFTVPNASASFRLVSLPPRTQLDSTRGSEANRSRELGEAIRSRRPCRQLRELPRTCRRRRWGFSSRRRGRSRQRPDSKTTAVHPLGWNGRRRIAAWSEACICMDGFSQLLNRAPYFVLGVVSLVRYSTICCGRPGEEPGALRALFRAR